MFTFLLPECWVAVGLGTVVSCVIFTCCLLISGVDAGVWGSAEAPAVPFNHRQNNGSSTTTLEATFGKLEGDRGAVAVM